MKKTILSLAMMLIFALSTTIFAGDIPIVGIICNPEKQTCPPTVTVADDDSPADVLAVIIGYLSEILS